MAGSIERANLKIEGSVGRVVASPYVTRKRSNPADYYTFSRVRVHGETWAFVRASSGGGGLSFSIKISLKRCRASRQVVQTLPGITVTAARLWQFSILPRSQSTPPLNDSAAARLGLEKSNGQSRTDAFSLSSFRDFVIIRISILFFFSFIIIIYTCLLYSSEF